MANEKQHIDNYLAEGLKNLDVTPPPDVWKNIEKHLDNKKRTRLISIWTALAAGLALLIGIGTYMRYDTVSSKTVKPNEAMVIAHPGGSVQTPALPDKSDITEPKALILSSNKASGNGSGDLADHHEVDILHNEKEALLANALQIASENKPTDPSDNSNMQNHVALKDETLNDAFLNPLSISLNSKVKQNLILQPSHVSENKPVMVHEPLFPDIAEDPEPPKIERWSIAGQVAPLYSYRTSNQSTQNDEKGLMAYAGGVKVDYKASRRFSIQVGVYYDVMGQTIDKVQISSYPSTGLNTAYATNAILVSASNSMGAISSNTGISRNTNSSYFAPLGADNIRNVPLQAYNNKGFVANSSDASVIQKLSFIEIPFLARYKLIDKKMGLHLIGGFSTNFLVNNYVLLDQDGNSENIGQTEGINYVNYSSTIGFGINYELFKKIDLSFEPTYKYYLKSISTNKDINFRPYAFGLFTGLVYKF